MRTALREYATQVRKRKQEERETAVFQKHKKELGKQERGHRPGLYAVASLSNSSKLAPLNQALAHALAID